MQREIKFRFWDWYNIRHDIKSGDNITINDIFEWDLTIMQFTWLYDKNWKEIYEWDKLNVYWKIWIVEYNHASFILTDENWENHWSIFTPGEYEIVWNIYKDSF